MKTERQYKVLSLYSGAGGMDLGFDAAGFETIFAVDFDKHAIETLNGALRTSVGVHGDVDSIRLPSLETVDVVIGGPPCQGFSVAGHMDPTDMRNRHVWRFLEIVGQVSPRAFVMENVKHLGENQRWLAVREGLVAAAQAMGYQTKLVVLRASHFGVAQNRDRMFLIGSLDFSPEAPAPTTAELLPRSRQVLEQMPRIGSPGNQRLATAEITFATNPVLRRSPFAGMLFNGAGRPINLDAPSSTLPASMGGNKTPIVDQRWLDNAEESWVHIYHRHLMNGGKPYAMKSAPDYLRRLTIEEAAALQSFPLDMPWVGSTSAVFRQIGNAVPPRLAQAVAAQLMDQMTSSPTRMRHSSRAFVMDDLLSFADRSPSLF